MSGRAQPWPERFWRRVVKSDGCWIWTGAVKPNGYGSIGTGGRALRQTAYTHRLSWELANGPIPAGMHVLHHCDNPPCVRPDHLFLGTPADNIADMVAKGRSAPPDLTRHIGEENGRARITTADVRSIRERHAGGETMVAIARDLAVGETTIRNVVNGYRWRHVA